MTLQRKVSGMNGVAVRATSPGDETGLRGAHGQGGRRSGDRDGVGDAGPRATVHAELSAVRDVDVRAVGAGPVVGAGDVAVRVGAARGLGGSERRPVSE